MQNKAENFSIEEAMRLAQSDTGQQLLALLKTQNSEALRKATEQASCGNYEGASHALSSLLDSPEVKKLVAQMGGPHRG